jgi:hypothetical protein
MGVIRANFISFNPNNRSSLNRGRAARGFAFICSGAGISAVRSPVESDHTSLNLTYFAARLRFGRSGGKLQKKKNRAQK